MFLLLLVCQRIQSRYGEQAFKYIWFHSWFRCIAFCRVTRENIMSGWFYLYFLFGFFPPGFALSTGNRLKFACVRYPISRIRGWFDLSLFMLSVCYETMCSQWAMFFILFNFIQCRWPMVSEHHFSSFDHHISDIRISSASLTRPTKFDLSLLYCRSASSTFSSNRNLFHQLNIFSISISSSYYHIGILLIYSKWSMESSWMISQCEVVEREKVRYRRNTICVQSFSIIGVKQ